MQSWSVYNINIVLILSLFLLSCHLGGNVNNVDYKPKVTEPLLICLDITCKEIAGPLIKLPINQSRSLYFTLNPAYQHKITSYHDIEIICNTQPSCPFKIVNHPPCSLNTQNSSNQSCEIVIDTETAKPNTGANIIATVKELKNNKVSTFISLV